MGRLRATAVWGTLVISKFMIMIMAMTVMMMMMMMVMVMVMMAMTKVMMIMMMTKGNSRVGKFRVTLQCNGAHLSKELPKLRGYLDISWNYLLVAKYFWLTHMHCRYFCNFLCFEGVFCLETYITVSFAFCIFWYFWGIFTCRPVSQLLVAAKLNFC